MIFFKKDGVYYGGSSQSCWNDIKKREDCIYIGCHELICEHKCPFCGEKRSSIHSNYIRTIGDLPI